MVSSFTPNFPSLRFDSRHHQFSPDPAVPCTIVENEFIRETCEPRVIDQDGVTRSDLLHVGFVGNAGIFGALGQVLDPLNGNGQLFRDVVVVDAVVDTAEVVFGETLKMI